MDTGRADRPMAILRVERSTAFRTSLTMSRTHDGIATLPTGKSLKINRRVF